MLPTLLNRSTYTRGSQPRHWGPAAWGNPGWWGQYSPLPLTLYFHPTLWLPPSPGLIPPLQTLPAQAVCAAPGSLPQPPAPAWCGAPRPGSGLYSKYPMLAILLLYLLLFLVWLVLLLVSLLLWLLHNFDGRILSSELEPVFLRIFSLLNMPLG